MEVSDVMSLYAYNKWANARMFSAVVRLDQDVFDEPRGSSFSSIRDTLAHIAMSEWVWLRRWRGESPGGPPEWALLTDAAGLAAKLGEVEVDRAAFLGELTDISLATALAYRNLKGEDFLQPLEDQMLHVVNHSTYHRGQIATLLRQAGTSAPATDLIVFKREGVEVIR